MKIIIAIRSGLSGSLKVWKGIFIYWIISLLMVSFIVVPLKASLLSALGNSMITEKLEKGINIDVLGDLGTNLHSMASSLFSGIILLTLAAVFINAFIAGGLFDSLRNNSGRFIPENFFRAAAKNFWSCLIINLSLCLIVISLIFVVIIIPVLLAANSDSWPEGTAFLVFDISFVIFLIALSLTYLIADYSRAWQASQIRNAGFKALGFGFRLTFGTFLSSFPLVLIMMVLQLLPAWGLLKIIAGYIPSKEGGILLLFLISQTLFFLKIFFKVLRYGSVTSLMEQNTPQIPDKELPSLTGSDPGGRSGTDSSH